MVLLAVGSIAATVEMRKMELRASHMPAGVHLPAVQDSHAKETLSHPCTNWQQACLSLLADLFCAELLMACKRSVMGRILRQPLLGQDGGIAAIKSYQCVQ